MNCYGNFHIILILYSEKYICGPYFAGEQSRAGPLACSTQSVKDSCIVERTRRFLVKARVRVGGDGWRFNTVRCFDVLVFLWHGPEMIKCGLAEITWRGVQNVFIVNDLGIKTDATI